MKKIKSFLVTGGVVFLITLSAKAQQVVSSTGGNAQNSSGSMSYTLGELVIDTRTSVNTTITQGFHQSKLTITTIGELPNLSFSMTAFPNPTNDLVTLKAENGKHEKLAYVLCDLNGKFILKGEMLNGEVQISFAALTPATYIIKIMQEGKDLKTLKIVKQ